MSNMSKNIKLSYIDGETLTVRDLRRFTNEIDHLPGCDELEVSIDPNGVAFTIEGSLEEV